MPRTDMREERRRTGGARACANTPSSISNRENALYASPVGFQPTGPLKLLHELYAEESLPPAPKGDAAHGEGLTLQA
ncbi:hypothetical protein UY3_11521 [Chelonia mydas]|uniref:Uncharacterized protein n=1 Tax=Chelonia mydas TaxID=8469 RepID=M7BT36_CHEMY|nr:hypothetical protein UY3_11521 [Chelonia mydas]